MAQEKSKAQRLRREARGRQDPHPSWPCSQTLGQAEKLEAPPVTLALFITAAAGGSSHSHTRLTHSILRTPTQPTLTLTLTHTRGASSSSPLGTHHPAAETPSCLHLPHHLLSASARPPPPSALVSEGATLGWWVAPPHFFLPAELVVMGPQQQDAHARTLRQRLPDRQQQTDRRTGRWKARFSQR